MALTNLRASTMQTAMEIVAQAESFGVTIKVSDVIDAAVTSYVKRARSVARTSFPASTGESPAPGGDAGSNPAAPTNCPRKKCARYYRMSGCVGCTRYPYPQDRFTPAKE